MAILSLTIFIQSFTRIYKNYYFITNNCEKFKELLNVSVEKLVDFQEQEKKSHMSLQAILRIFKMT